ncbi:MAG: FHA domain-containing protein [Betaproteobacteria bacterium]|nr:FHA domain-containing protein [Betaproteobacteria bacterium]
MAKLILSLEGSVIREVPLDKERVTIGRKPQNDIQIENLAVSGEHARVVTILKDSFLEDLGSTNGTLVNGNPVTKHILQNSDVIEIGKYKLKYVVDATSVQPGPQAPAEDMEKTMIVRGPVGARTAVPPPGAAAPAAAVPAAATPSAAALQILNGPGAGRELAITKNLTTLGKPGVQVAVITRRPQGYFIAHVEGKAFPIVNGKTLDAQAHPLNDHDVVELGGVKMEFFYKAK